MYRSYTEFRRGITVFHRVTKKQKPIENYTTQLCKSITAYRILKARFQIHFAVIDIGF